MNLQVASIDNVVVSLLIAVFVWFLGDITINFFVADPKINKLFHGILLAIVLLIAILGSFVFPR